MSENTPKPTNQYKRLLTNTAVFTVGKLLSKLLVFFMIGLYTACLSEAEFGTAELITGAANLLIPLACVGISEGLFRSAAAKTGDKEAFFTNGLVVYGVGSVIFLLLSPLLGIFIFFVIYYKVSVQKLCIFSTVALYKQKHWKHGGSQNHIE